MKLCIFEDEKVSNFIPLTWSRPVYLLRCGMTSLAKRISIAYPNMELVYHCRDFLTETVAETTGSAVNVFEDDRYLCINGRVVFGKDIASHIPLDVDNRLYCSNGIEIAAVLSGECVNILNQNAGKLWNFRQMFPGLSVETIEAKAFEYPWDIINTNGDLLSEDFHGRVFESAHSNCSLINKNDWESVHLINESTIAIGTDTILKPGVVLDAENGPIVIGAGSVVMPNAVIEGPVFIGENSLVKAGARIGKGTTIGEYCKVGGEISSSIIHSYSSKQHDGFLGNSYLGQWVNIGAGTNTSNLKNNYKNVKVTVGNKEIDTGSLFLGLIMGDHSKTGINTMFNTGTVVGVSCNIFGGGFPPKYIPSFSWGGSEKLEEYKIGKALETAQHVVSRRKMKLSVAFRSLITYIFENSSGERAKF
ncbi:hypothetical protein IID62_07835 [candidate division KSB1 bacterium]|nr:hypothetical protein [candidate division KSB1 bacterium]